MAQTNRDAFIKAKKFLSQFKDLEFYDSEIYLLLIKANNYLNFTELIKHFDENLANPEYFFRNIQRIKEGEPIQYVTGEAPFFDLDIKVNSNVLIPRPETEGLTKFTIDYIKKENIPHKVIADVCTGSGCIAIYLKKHFPDSDIYATVEPLISRHIRLDVLISNPPYVEKMEDIEDKVKKYEPLNAIYIQDGTKFYESYFKHHKEVMKDKFFMAFEINYDQEEKLTFLIRNYFDLNKIQYKFVIDIFDKTRYLFIKGDYSENSK